MTFCAEPGCPELVAAGRCPVHARELERARGSTDARGYTKRWRRRSSLFRARYPLCGMRPNGRAPVMSECFATGRVTLATVVDHVVPHRGDHARFWDELENWQALCGACHARKTAAGS